MRREHNGVASLEGNHRLIDNRRGRVGRRHNAHQQANRLGDRDNLALLVSINNADGLLVLNLLVEQGARDVVLVHLVAHLAKARLLNGHAGKHLSVLLGNLNHVAKNAVDLLLVKVSELVGGNLTLASELTRSLNALEIEIVVLHESPFEYSNY